MTTFTARGKQLLQDVIYLETDVIKNRFIKTAGKTIDSLELRLSTIRGDFERQAKNIVSKIPSNKRSNQNVINASNRVKRVKIADMNSELNKLRKLTNGKASEPTPGTASASNFNLQEIKNLFTKTDGQIKNIGSKIGL